MAKHEEDIETLMRQMNASAHEIASKFDITLDYSDDSVHNVELILGQLHDHYKQTQDDTGLRGIALFFAAYLGEVIRRKGRGGTWSRDHPSLGEDSFPFNWNGGDLFIFGWCLKRIFDGKADDVAFKYRALVLMPLENGDVIKLELAPMDAERRRQLKASGKAEVERRSAANRAAMAAANPAPIGSSESAPMNAERRRQLKAAGKAEVERRSSANRAAMAAANPAPIGSDEWGRRYRVGTQRERWLRRKLPVLHKAALESMFVVCEDVGEGWVPHEGGYVRCLKCGSVAPSMLPRRWFYWAQCACGNIRWRCVLAWRRGDVADPANIEPVRLIGKG